MAVLQDRQHTSCVVNTCARRALGRWNLCLEDKGACGTGYTEGGGGGKVDVTVKVGGVCGAALYRVITLSA